MNDKNNTDRSSSGTTVRLAERFPGSARFKALFSEGMGLVEESAEFLDDKGRQAAKELPREAAVLYAAESMRLTTRLMQLASWLLLQRAIGNGEMTREQAAREKQKVKLDQLSSNAAGPGWADLPAGFADLVDRSLSLQVRIRRLDEEIFGETEIAANAGDNPVNAQLNLLSTALGAAVER